MLTVLFLLWLVFNGRITTEILALGALITTGLAWLSIHFLGYSFSAEGRLLSKVPLFLVYAAHLFIEIVKANVHVIRLVLSPKIVVKPSLVHFQIPLKTMGARVMLANSITLTPGTITIDLDEQGYYVHNLDHESAMESSGSLTVRLLERMER